MPLAEESIELARSPGEVAEYLLRTAPAEGFRLTERADSGSRGRPAGTRTFAMEVPDDSPAGVEPDRFDRMVHPVMLLAVEPLPGGDRTRVTVDVDIEGRGIGRLVAPFFRRLVRRQAAEEGPMDLALADLFAGLDARGRSA
jgi:hypothetical protein